MIQARELHQMVEAIDRQFKLDSKVKEAFCKVNRKYFVPPVFAHLANQLEALPLAQSQWISSPVTVAKMTQYLELDGVDSILEIGCGSGYQAAILSQLVRRVFTVERIDVLLKEARNRFSQLELYNIFTRFDDGLRGWKEYAPYERILFSATATEIPETIFDQLAEGGILLAPMQEGSLQILTRFYKRHGRITSETIEPCFFVPIVEGTQREATRGI
ncbi:MAG TPA: protein-L-isoaspartate(D-aspartate) O-methyltransferase [Epsilonproteobacteria bacterium]|nr:protein-L-isoaspartate(D-aspartate) O-methyltransferase [Campylobacterota bacterium]